MTKFRPCIDLHAGHVKQIVGGTLSNVPNDLRTNYVSEHPASFYADLYRKYGLLGAHVIMLGPGNDAAAKEAVQAWPGKLQVGGGITDANAQQWIDAGAEKVLASIGHDKKKLVIDLSCRRQGSRWYVAMNKWQTITDMEVNQESISMLEPYCSEFLIHAADNEGLQRGMDDELISRLADWCSIPVTYAGGGRSLSDLEVVREKSAGKVDLTIGSALDIFGGSGVTFQDCVNWNTSNS